MGAPSDEQIDEIIACGLANRWSEDRMLQHLATLERMTDEELAAIGVFPPPPESGMSPSMSPSPADVLSPSRGVAPRGGRPRRSQSGGSGSAKGRPCRGAWLALRSPESTQSR